MSADETDIELGQAPAAALPLDIGAQLAQAREAAGLTLADVAARTRIQQRYLAAIDRGDLAALPGRTYAIGFARNYARVVGLDETEAAAAMRAELDGSVDDADTAPTVTFSPGDPARVPSARFAWVAGAATLVVAIIALVWWHQSSETGELPSLLPAPTQAARPAAALPAASAVARAPGLSAAPATAGPVVFTATIAGLWVKFSDAAGKQLMQKQMALNETYTVPADAVGPKLWTGRPEALSITIGGHPVPRLAEVQRTMKDVPVSAQALLARALLARGVVSPVTPTSTKPTTIPTVTLSPGAHPAVAIHTGAAHAAVAKRHHAIKNASPEALAPGPVVSGTATPEAASTAQ